MKYQFIDGEKYNTNITGSVVNIDARNESALTAALLSVGGSGGVGVEASIAINTIGKFLADKEGELGASGISDEDLNVAKIDSDAQNEAFAYNCTVQVK